MSFIFEKEVIHIATQKTDKNPIITFLLRMIRRLIIILVTVFIITAVTFYSVQKKINQSTVYLENSAYESVSESAFSIFTDTFGAYIKEAFPGLGGVDTNEK